MKILIADNNPVTAKLFEKILVKNGHEVIIAENGQKAWELFQKNNFRMLIANWTIPEIDGVTLCNKIKASSLPYYVHTILQTTREQLSDMLELKANADDYILKPLNVDQIIARVSVGICRIELEENISKMKTNINKRPQEIGKSYGEISTLLSSLLDMLNPVLGEYMKHSGRICRELAQDFGLEKKMVNQIEMAGLFHDVGLLGLPPLMLFKDETQMDKTELSLYTQHPVIAFLSFKTVKNFSEISEIILSHHENFDGSGFPSGLKGSQIPVGSRIVAAVSDYFKIIHTWPTDLEEIKKKAEDNFGHAITEVFDTIDLDILTKQIAIKSLEIESNRKYDADVVEKLINRIANEKEIKKNKKWIDIDELKEGMVLAENFCLKDGKHLLSNNTVLNSAAIGSLKQLKGFNVLDDQIFVLIPELSI